ncbi:adenylate/guanylate cyclase domain-containing protein [Bradyrhizobium sp. USDA 4469]
MAEARVERRLAAILAADVAGYSRLMSADEVGTLAALKAHRREVVDPAITQHQGRIVKTTGDGMLVEFASAVEAVTCAVELQQKMAQRTATGSGPRILFRIGINVGDIIIDGDDIFGDGVNIAARLEGIAEPGGVWISDDAHRHIRGKVDIVVDDMGPQALKNIAEPMRVWSCQINANASSAAPTRSSVEMAQPLAITGQPSIAVLPFTCFSEEREFKFLTEAMSEDLITMLARIPGFIVIARQSAFAYQGRSVDSRQIGRELGVRYIIEGSLRLVGQQLRVGTQLIDAMTGAQLWADRFDGQAGDILGLQDQMVRAIASRIEPELVRAEVALIRRRRDANPNAWSCFRQGAGLISLQGWSEETLAQATALLRQATTLDPNFALARAQLALFLSLGARLRLVTDGAAAVTEARSEAERAVTIDHDASEVLGYAGCALAELGDVQRGTEILERAIENDPSNAQAWVALGTSLCFLEKMDATGLEKLRHGMRLSPRDHRLGFWGTFYALALQRHGRATEAHEEVRAACRRDPQFYVARIVLALIAAGLDKKEEAVVALREARRLRPRLSFNEIQFLVGRRAALLAPLWSEISNSSQ